MAFRPITGLQTVFGVIPLLVIPMIIYVALSLPLGQVDIRHFSTLPLISGAKLALSLGDLILLIAGGLMVLEVAKSADTSHKALIDAGLSIGLMVLCWIAWLVIPMFGTATFLILTVMQTVDGIGGTLVSIQAARRDWGAGAGG
jgi:hypothetical protein